MEDNGGSGEFNSGKVRHERASNVFLHAIAKRGHLHEELLRCQPFDALLVPCQSRIDEEQLTPDNFTASFLRAHLLRNTTNRQRKHTQFITVAGQRGSFSDDFTSVTVAGFTLNVRCRLPAKQLPGAAPGQFTDLSQLEVFIISEGLVPLAALHGNGSGSFEGAGLGALSMIREPDATQPFREFQARMQDRVLRPVAKSIRSFVQRAVDCGEQDPQELRTFIRMTAQEAFELWGVQADGRRVPVERTVEDLHEDLERYVMTKLYDTLCALKPSEEQTARELSQRIERLAPHVVPADITLLPQIPASRRWAEAVRSLQTVPDYKTPRDMQVKLLNAFNILSALAVKVSGADVGADVLTPALIYAVMQANVPGLRKHIRSVLLYRQEAKLTAESQYALTAVESGVLFWEKCTPDMLRMEKQRFTDIVEGRAVSPRPLSGSASVSVSATTSVHRDPVSAPASAPASAPVSTPASPTRQVPRGRISVVDEEERERRAASDAADATARSEHSAALQVEDERHAAAIAAVEAEEAEHATLQEAEGAAAATALADVASADRDRLQEVQAALRAFSEATERRLVAGLGAVKRRELALQERYDFVVAHTARLAELQKARDTEHARRVAAIESAQRSAAQEVAQLRAAFRQEVTAAHAELHATSADLDRQRQEMQETARRAADAAREREQELRRREAALEAQAKRMADDFDRRDEAVAAREAALAAETEQRDERMAKERQQLVQMGDNERAAIAALEEALAVNREHFDDDLAAGRGEAAQWSADVAALVDAERDHGAERHRDLAADIEALDSQLATLVQHLADERTAVDAACAARAKDAAAVDAALDRKATAVGLREKATALGAEEHRALVEKDRAALARKDADLLQRRADDETYAAGIQKNFDDRDRELQARHSELAVKLEAGEADAARKVAAAAKERDEHIDRCHGHFRTALSQMSQADQVGEVPDYNNLRVSDLQNLWKTMDALREIRKTFTDVIGDTEPGSGES